MSDQQQQQQSQSQQPESQQSEQQQQQQQPITIKTTNSVITTHSRFNELSSKKTVYMIGVPKCHENLYKHIEEAAHKDGWLIQTTRNGNPKKSYGKRINTDEDRKKLEKLILDLRTEKSELFIDKEFHPKPYNQPIIEYIDEFLKTKGVNNHYTFVQFYRITVFPNHVKNIDKYLFDLGQQAQKLQQQREQGSNNSDKEIKGDNISYPLMEDEREEYIIVPLLIILKRGKTFSQSKMIVGVDSSNGSGKDGNNNNEVIVEDVKPQHFYIVPPAPSDDDDDDDDDEE